MSEEVEEEFAKRHKQYRRKSASEGHHGIRSGYHEAGFTDPAESVRRMRAEVADAVTITEMDRIVDLGCGFGDSLVWLADEVGASGIGIDIAEPNLEVARDLAKERGVESKVDFRRGDFHELSSLLEDPVDVVWATESLMYTKRIETVIEEVGTVLRESGRFVVGDTFRREEPITSTQKNHFATIREGDSAHYSNIQEVEEQLIENGFNVERRVITEHVKPELDRITTFARLYRPLFALGHRLGLVSAERLASIGVPIATSKLFEDGVLEYYILTARL